MEKYILIVVHQQLHWPGIIPQNSELFNVPSQYIVLTDAPLGSVRLIIPPTAPGPLVGVGGLELYARPGEEAVKLAGAFTTITGMGSLVTENVVSSSVEDRCIDTMIVEKLAQLHRRQLRESAVAGCQVFASGVASLSRRVAC